MIDLIYWFPATQHVGILAIMNVLIITSIAIGSGMRYVYCEKRKKLSKRGLKIKKGRHKSP